MEKDDLEIKANDVVDEKIYDKDVDLYIKERWGTIRGQHRTYIKELLKGRKCYQAYITAYGTSGQSKSIASAKAASSRLNSKLKIEFSETLDWLGHGSDSIVEALDTMREEDVDGYLRHITKLKKLDVQRVEHSGKVGVYKIEFTSDKVEDE